MGSEPTRSVEPVAVDAQLLRRVRRTLDDGGASLAGRRVLALCSGGADSVALVVLLAALPRGAAPRSIDVLWLDHALRADLAHEQEAARAVAARVGAGFHERRAPDAAPAAAAGGAEAAARSWRYEVAEAVAHAVGCDVVATGHTASDQLESALLALVGVTGRSGGPDAMPVTRPLAPGIELARPLLGISRADAEHACRHAGLAWGHDPTNDDPDAHVRNAIRHRVVPPLLEAHPGAGPALLRAAARTRAAGETTRSLADALLDAWQVDQRIDVRLLASLAAPARRELLARWLARQAIGRGVTSRIVQAVDRLAVLPGRAPCASVDLPGHACVRRDGYHLRIQHAPDTEGPTP